MSENTRSESAEWSVGLDGLRFYSRIGVYEQERVAGNEFSVDLEVRFARHGDIADNLSLTVSYADLYEIVKVKMGECCMLLETVCERIAAEIRSRWPELSGGRVRIRKCTPPISGCDGSSYCELRF